MSPRSLSVRRRVAAPPELVYDAVSDLRRMAAWSEEYVGSWRFWRGAPRAGVRFVGWNRSGWRLWFTTCRVIRADRPAMFAFESSVLGLPIARWSYAIEPAPDGASDVTESWRDLREGGVAGAMGRWLGTVFTGTTPEARVDRNARGMRITLRRLAIELTADKR